MEEMKKSMEEMKLSMEKMEDSMKAMESALGNIDKQVICYLCKSKPKAGEPKWYRCTQLHFVCQSCKDTKSYCPCSGKILGKPCSVIEEFLKSIKRFKCKYESYGCEEIFRNEDLAAHELQCTCRLVQCPGCGWMIPFQDLIEHMKTKFRDLYTPNIMMDQLQLKFDECYEETHSFDGTILVLETSWNRVQNWGSVLEIIEWNKNIFFIIIMHYRKFDDEHRLVESTLYHWVSFMGTPEQAKQFSYTFEYLSLKHGTCSYTGQVISIDETADEVKEEEKAAAFGFDSFKKKFVKFTTNDGKEKGIIKYSVTIRNLEEEVKDE